MIVGWGGQKWKKIVSDPSQEKKIASANGLKK